MQRKSRSDRKLDKNQPAITVYELLQGDLDESRKLQLGQLMED